MASHHSPVSPSALSTTTIPTSARHHCSQRPLSGQAQLWTDAPQNRAKLIPCSRYFKQQARISSLFGMFDAMDTKIHASTLPPSPVWRGWVAYLPAHSPPLRHPLHAPGCTSIQMELYRVADTDCKAARTTLSKTLGSNRPPPPPTMESGVLQGTAAPTGSRHHAGTDVPVASLH